MKKRLLAWMLFAGMVSIHMLTPKALAGETMTRIEASFELPQVSGNPFDPAENNVEVTLSQPQHTRIILPAFYDGGTTWRVRHTPGAVGKYTIESIALNGKDAHAQKLTPREFDITTLPTRQFVRINPKDPMRFAFDDGSTYYPVGYDLAWHQDGASPLPPLTGSLERMGRAGINWTRIWMNHWDGKNLDWASKDEPQPPLGQLSLIVAKHWDQILDAAYTNGVYVQLTLQHHGQYSSRTDPNWAINPWNKVNGGWLDSPVEFFSDAKAKSLTKAKYRYIVARWGSSPAIMGWELFNEVESADASRANMDLVAAWHQEMAGYLRQIDRYKHLITTSSNTSEPRLWPATDYYQAHTYPSDMLAAIADLDAQQLKRPYFYGEFGGPNSQSEMDPPRVLHQGLWASLMSQSSGAAQYWFWYLIEPADLFSHFTAVQNFIHLSGMTHRQNNEAFQVGMHTDLLATMKIGPGVGWAASRSTHFTLSRDGSSDSVSGMSAFLQGEGANRPMFPSATFEVDYPLAGEFSVHVDQIADQGATLQLSIDNRLAATLELPGLAEKPRGKNRSGQNEGHLNASLSVPVPAGKHVILMNNSGADWVHIQNLKLTSYTSGLGVLGKGNNQACVVWIYRRETNTPNAISGSLSLPAMQPGSYRVVWWDTYKGRVIKEESKSTGPSGGLVFDTIPVDTDVAVFVERSNASH